VYDSKGVRRMLPSECDRLLMVYGMTSQLNALESVV
jgi:hypothetical protein